MTAHWHTRRTCPACGVAFKLGTAAIVGLLPDRGSGTAASPSPSSAALPIEEDTHVESEAGRGLQPGELVTSTVDDEPRLVLAPAPRRPRMGGGRPLPTAHDLATQHGHRGSIPRRGCPWCHHPLPLPVDVADVPAVVLLGDTQSGKTAFVAAVRAQAHAEFPGGRHRLTVTADARHILDRIVRNGRTLQQRYLGGEPLIRTQAGRRTPLEFSAHVFDQTAERSTTFAVQLNDPAGEDIVNPETLERSVPALRWASVIVLMVPPQAPGTAADANDRAGALLGSVVDGFTGLAPDRWPHLIVCASMADKSRAEHPMLTRRELDHGPGTNSSYTEDLVKTLIRERDPDVGHHAYRWQGHPVLWRAVAAQPQDTRPAGEPMRAWGVVRLVDDMVEALR